jgi:protein involved in polysaccharide export with SLBB domain
MAFTTFSPAQLLTKMRVSRFFLFAVLFVSFVGCKVSRPQQMLTDLQKDSVLTFTPQLIEQTIRPGDQLNILVSSLNREEDAIYNATSVRPLEVQIDGTFSYHRLGTIRAVGLTRRQLAAKMKKDLEPYLRDALVYIQFANHRATFVVNNSPVMVSVPEENLPLLDALALAKTSSSVDFPVRLSHVTRIREQGAKGQAVSIIDLTKSTNLFQPDNYFVKPNDLILLREDLEIAVKEEKRKRFPQVFGLILTGINVLVLIGANLFRR